MTLNFHDTVLSQLTAVDKCVEPLELLGVITDKDADLARAAAARAHHAAILGARYAAHIEDAARAAGEQLAEVDDLDLATVADAAALPDAGVIDVALAAIWKHNTDAARRIAFAHNAKVPAALTAQFDAVSDEILAIAAKLGPVSTPQEAMDADLTEQWQRLMALKHEYNALAALRDTMRSFHLIPSAPSPSDEGWHWNLRYPFPVGAFNTAQARKVADEGRAVLILNARCRPYVPASREEARATLEAADRGEAFE